MPESSTFSLCARRGSLRNDNILAGSGEDVIYGGEGNDSVYGDAGNDRLIGGSGNDWLSGEEGQDIVEGGEGDDTLYGGDFLGDGRNLEAPGSDTLIGGAGNDRLDGGLGDDTYVFEIGHGRDLIRESYTAYNPHNHARDPGYDVIRFGAGISSSDISFEIVRRRVGYLLDADLIIRNNSTGDRITVENVGLGAHDTESGIRQYLSMINEIQFHDGTVISFNDIVNSLARRLYGTDQQDSIYGSADSEELYGFGGADHIRGLDGDDRIDGGAGNDGLLSGGRGSDTYLFNLGNGTDTIFDSYLESGPVNPLDKDVVEMGRHIDPSQIFVFLADDGLHLEVAFEDQIILRDENPLTAQFDLGIEEIRFQDGTVWTSADLMSRIEPPTWGINEITGTGSADTINGTGGNDWILGLAGNDVLHGLDGDDQLDGGLNNDTLYGGTGYDTLTGGEGNDSLIGGIGDDTYLISRGDGRDSIADNDASSGNYDVLEFNSGVTYDQLWFERSSGSDDLEISIIGTTDRLVIKDWYLGGQYHVEEIYTRGDRRFLFAADVQALVGAMAGMTPPPQGQTTLTAAQRAVLAPVFAVAWGASAMGAQMASSSLPAMMATDETAIWSEAQFAVMASDSRPRRHMRQFENAVYLDNRTAGGAAAELPALGSGWMDTLPSFRPDDLALSGPDQSGFGQAGGWGIQNLDPYEAVVPLASTPGMISCGAYTSATAASISECRGLIDVMAMADRFDRGAFFTETNAGFQFPQMIQ